MDKLFLEITNDKQEISNLTNLTVTVAIRCMFKFYKVNLSSKDYLTRAFAPSVFSESTLLPSIRIYTKEPRKPAPKLNT